MAEAYCVKDKKKVEVVNPQKITMKNGKPAISGTCPICGGKVFKIGGLTARAPVQKAPAESRRGLSAALLEWRRRAPCERGTSYR